MSPDQCVRLNATPLRSIRNHRPGMRLVQTSGFRTQRNRRPIVSLPMVKFREGALSSMNDWPIWWTWRLFCRREPKSGRKVLPASVSSTENWP